MIVSCGEALIDFVPSQTAGGEPAYVPRPGGSPFNVAVTVGRLGASAGFLGSVSADFFGAQLVAALRASKVDVGYVSVMERPSTLAFVNLDSVEPEYVFYDREAAHRFWSPTVDLRPDVTMLHFGSLSLIDDPAAHNYADLMRRDKQRRVMSLDPNIRPTVVRGNEEAYRARLSMMLGLADLIKISAADLAWLAPSVDVETTVAGWLADGAAIVVVTRGAAGSTAYRQDRPAIERVAKPITLVDTVGAGDSFMGALLVGFDAFGVTSRDDLRALDDTAIERVLGFATTVSAITCSRAGADPPWSGEVELPVSTRAH